jgi:glutaredoxin
MTSSAIKFAAVNALLLMAAGVFSAPSGAQTVYRSVGPDGKVTYSDQPPPAASRAKATAAAGDGGRAVAMASLPFELRKVASQFPVTLYTSDNCAPCVTARSMLLTRGIPFAEKTVKTFEDTQALQRISGDSSLPFLTIGSQQHKGFSDAEWTQFLDAAGYPKASVLPASYRQAAATPLVTIAPAAPAVAARPSPATAQDESTALPPANPAGIRF